MNVPTTPADAGAAVLPDAARNPRPDAAQLHTAHQGEGGRVVKTLSWPLALAVICLIIYASLYPFADWRNQGISPLRYVTAPWPKYWTGFDVGVNLLGYAPLGFLLALAMLHHRRVRWPVSVAVLCAGLLSLTMEGLQSYLPSRVPSNVDLALNTLGGWLGACVAWGLVRTGWLGHWRDLKARWFAHDARGALVLLLLWPPALLFPAAIPMGLGQVFERLESALADFLMDTPFLEWLPVRDVELQPLVPVAELLCVALGALIPCLLAYGVIGKLWQRVVFAAAALTVGVLTSALSAALSYGPDHAWAWLDEPVKVGVGLAAVLALVFLRVPRRAAAALTLLALAVQLGLLNQAPADPYFAQTLQIWEQGRFINFYGLAQWLGWLWPYAALLYMVLRLSRRDPLPQVEK